jgi:hypothetical protein
MSALCSQAPAFPSRCYFNSCCEVTTATTNRGMTTTEREAHILKGAAAQCSGK